MTAARPLDRAWIFKIIQALGMIFITLLLAACVEPRTAIQPTISLRLQGTPAEALVIIDEEAVGQLDFIALHGVALPPGTHRITVKARGYFPWDRLVQANVGASPIRLDVALVPVPD
jgi:hypothetical protein